MASEIEASIRIPRDAHVSCASTMEPSQQRFNIFSRNPNNKHAVPPCELSTKQSMAPIALIALMYFVLGFTYGLSGTLTKRFQDALDLSKAQSTGTLIAYYIAYGIAPLTYGGWLVRRYGYRLSIILALGVHAVSSFLFWPSGVKRSFAGFCVASFIGGNGASILEAAATPFVTTCGPPKWAELRLNVVKAMSSVASVTGLVVASYVIFDSKSVSGEQSTSLEAVEFLFIGIGSAYALLLVLFFFTQIPEIPSRDLNEQQPDKSSATSGPEQPLRKQSILVWGIVAYSAFIASQSSIGQFAINYLTETGKTTPSSAARYLAIAHGVFAFGRLLTCLLLRCFKPRFVLLVSNALLICFVSGAMFAIGDKAVVIICFNFLVKSGIGPIIFSISLRGLGKRTDRGASYLVASEASSALVSPAFGIAADHFGTAKAFFIPLICAAVAFTFPLYLNGVKGKQLDALRTDSDSEKRECDSSTSSPEDTDAECVQVERKLPTHDEK